MVISPFEYCDQRQTPPMFVARGDGPEGWWGRGKRINLYQSWERPFLLYAQMSKNRDDTGPIFRIDTGEAFSWFVESPQHLAQAPLSGMGGAFLSAFTGIPMMPVPQMPAIKLRNGRPERQFLGIGAYLDTWAKEIATPAPGSGQAMPCIEILGERLVGEDEATASARERKKAIDEAAAWKAMDEGFCVRSNAILDRFLMRRYRLTSMSTGIVSHLFVGAKVTGQDILCFPGRPTHEVPANSWPFGQANTSGARLYEVDWMVEKRFHGLIAEGDGDVEEFGEMVTRAARTLAFSKALMDEMRAERQRLSDLSAEQRKKEIAEFHAYNQELSQRLRQEDAKRQERMRQHEEQLRADRERRRSWDRKMESDRRVRDAWSEAIRGTERYRDPYGHMVEVSVTGPNQRAFYDHLSGRTVMSDITDLDKPSDWEELPRW